MPVEKAPAVLKARDALNGRMETPPRYEGEMSTPEYPTVAGVFFSPGVSTDWLAAPRVALDAHRKGKTADEGT